MPMMTARKRTFSLPAEHVKYIDAKVESGVYASGSEVVRAGLRALQERDAAVERWLLNEVGPTYGAMAADPSRAIKADTVFSELRRRGHRAIKRGS